MAFASSRISSGASSEIEFAAVNGVLLSLLEDARVVEILVALDRNGKVGFALDAAEHLRVQLAPANRRCPSSSPARVGVFRLQDTEWYRDHCGRAARRSCLRGCRHGEWCSSARFWRWASCTAWSAALVVSVRDMEIRTSFYRLQSGRTHAESAKRVVPAVFGRTGPARRRAGLPLS